MPLPSSNSARMSSARAAQEGSGKSSAVIVCQPRPRALACRTARSISANCASLSRRRQRDASAILRPCHTHAPLIGWISRIARPSLLLPHISGRA